MQNLLQLTEIFAATGKVQMALTAKELRIS